MISCTIPGRDTIEIKHLVCDVNGTLTRDGNLIPGVRESLDKLKEYVEIHLVRADTLGRLTEVETGLAGIITSAIRLKPGSEAEQKLECIQKLGSSTTAFDLFLKPDRLKAILRQ